MTLSSCILITIPVCISAILMQTYFDSRKYKRIPHLIVLLSFLFPTLSHAQYIDNENCRISFKSYENHQGKLEYNKEGIIYQFIPNSNAWKVIIKNNTDETVWLNWKQAGFIVNGRASGISLFYCGMRGDGGSGCHLCVVGCLQHSRNPGDGYPDGHGHCLFIGRAQFAGQACAVEPENIPDGICRGGRHRRHTGHRTVL